MLNYRLPSTENMGNTVYLAGDFSGIQRFVLGVKSTGKAQAKRLRARSFLLELFEYAALQTLKERLKITDDNDVLVRGGGGFLVRVPPGTDPARIENLHSDLQRKLWEESGGHIHISLGWAENPRTARDRLEYRKRRPGNSLLQSDGCWDTANWSRQPIDEPCQICGQFPGLRIVQDEDRNVRYCDNCLETRKLGAKLTQWEWMRSGNGPVRALGVAFEPLESRTPETFRVGRWIPRNPDSGEPLRNL